MNMTPSEGVAFVKKLNAALCTKTKCEIVVCVPDLNIPAVSSVLHELSSNIKVGAQNAHWELKGAFTGETSVLGLKELDVEYVIVGHSERRQLFGEINRLVNRRVKTIVDAGLCAIVCVGELLEERELGITTEIVSMQTRIALKDVSEEQMANIVIAYEPVWAIGTGVTATSDEADRMNGIIRAVIADMYNSAVAERTTIQYGGSMNAANAAELLAKPNVDGGLIGGASLKVDDFTTIINAAQ